MSDRSRTFELHRPVAFKGSELSEITLNAPTIGQIRQAQAKFRRGENSETTTEFGIALIARCAGIDEESVAELDADVFFSALEFATSFLPKEAAPKEALSEP